jgi:Domain of unknown function (DUF4352)
VTEPTKPDPWVGRATARPVDPWAADDTGYAAPTYVQPPPPGYVLVPEPPRRRRGLRVFLLVAGIFAACCAGGATLALLGNAAWRDVTSFGVHPAQADNPAPVDHPAPTTPAAPPTPTQPGLNTPVRDGKFEFVVSSVSCGQEAVGQAPITRQARGQFCVVDLSVQNIGTKDQLLVDGAQKAIGPDGAEYGPDTGAGLIANANTSVWLNVVKPGAKVAGKMVYDVPDGVQIVKLELHDSLFSNGATILLG